MEWFKRAIVYQIFIDRFAGYGPGCDNKPQFVGGNLAAITPKLIYIKSLGFNTIWLSPFYECTAYHGYHITDFFKIDSRFGNMSDFNELVNEVKKLDLKLIIDFVPNHVSKYHPFFKQACTNASSPYRKWFYFRKWPDKYLCFLYFTELPKLNLHCPETYDHVLKAAKFWINKGADALRLDHAMGPDASFWKKFYTDIKSDYPNSVLIGEAWCSGISFKLLKTVGLRNKYLRWLKGINQQMVQSEYTDLLDGVLDFKVLDILRQEIIQTHAPNKLRMQQRLARHYARYPDNFYLPAFLDNHDMNRILFECKHDKNKLNQLLEVLYSLPQPIIVYYGTENYQAHNTPIDPYESHSDLKVRKKMDWKHTNTKAAELLKQLAYSRLHK